jgi:hypothetical protein
MGYQTLDPQDLVLSADATVAPLWSNYKTNLTTFYTSSTQITSNQSEFYWTVYSTQSVLSPGEVVTPNTWGPIEFHLAWGDKFGRGTQNYNILVNQQSPSRTTYGQYKTLLFGDEENEIIFGDSYVSSNFYAINIERSRYKEKLLPTSLELNLDATGDWNTQAANTGFGGGKIKLISDALVNPPKYSTAGRYYQLVSGSLSGGIYTGKNSKGWPLGQGSYGLLFPDVGVILLNPNVLWLPMEASNNVWNGGIELPRVLTENTDVLNPRYLFLAISASGDFSLRSEETLSSNYVFVRARNDDFNYSQNPTYISGSAGELTHEIMVNQPITYITTIGLYNDNNELIAVAKLSRPLQKDFTKELLVRVKLDF